MDISPQKKFIAHWVTLAFFDELVSRGGVKTSIFTPPPEKSKNILIKVSYEDDFFQHESMKQNAYFRYLV